MEDTNALKDMTINVEAGVYQRMAKRADSDWMKDLRALMYNHDFVAALDIAVMCNADLPTIQRLYESKPDHLQGDTLELALKYGDHDVIHYLVEQSPNIVFEHHLAFACRDCEAQPDIIQCLVKRNPSLVSGNVLALACQYQDEPNIISFLASQRPEAVSCVCDEHKEGNEYPISIAMSNNADENDIRTLVDLWPEGLVTTMAWFDEENSRYGPRYLQSTPLYQCLQKGYSNELLDFMVKNLPESIDDFVMALPASGRKYVGARDLGWIEGILKRGKGTFLWKDFHWLDVKGFQEFLGLCFLQSNGFKSMHLDLPRQIPPKIDGVDRVDWSMLEFKKVPSLQENHSSSATEEVVVDLPHASYCSLLDNLIHWPRLLKLNVNVHRHLKPSMASICQLLNHGSLQHLTLRAAGSVMRSRKRKAHSNEAEMPLRGLFDVLASNSTLTHLEIRDIPNGERKVHFDHLLHALQQNTTLEKASGFSCNKEADDKLESYLNLNRCGRKQARDASTALRDFVTLFGSVDTRLDELWIFDEKIILSVQYGLLHEAIEKWI